MIEMLGVLAIMGVLTAGGMLAYTRAMIKNKINNTIEQAVKISVHLSAIGINGGNYYGLDTNSMAVLESLFPESIFIGDKMIAPYGGEVSIAPSNLHPINTSGYANLRANSSGYNLAYTIRYDGVDTPTCMALTTHEWGTVKNVYFIGVAAGLSSSVADTISEKIYQECDGDVSTDVIAGCVGGNTLRIPVPQAVAASVCTGCTDQKSCSVMLKYY